VARYHVYVHKCMFALVNLCVETERERERHDRDIVVFRLYRTMDPFPEVERKLCLIVWVEDNMRTDAASVHRLVFEGA